MALEQTLSTAKTMASGKLPHRTIVAKPRMLLTHCSRKVPVPVNTYDAFFPTPIPSNSAKQFGMKKRSSISSVDFVYSFEKFLHLPPSIP